METPLGTKVVADVVENASISGKDRVCESDSVDDNKVCSSLDDSLNEDNAECKSKTFYFKTKKNQNMERFYSKLVNITYK